MTHSEEKIITVFIVAASPIVRVGLEALLQTSEDFVVTGSAAEIFAAPLVSSVGRTAEMLLINVEEAQDFDDLLEFLGDSPEDVDMPPVVALFSPELESSGNIIRALQSGVRGVLPHHASREEIKAAVMASASGLISLMPGTLESILSSEATSNQIDSLIGGEAQRLSGESSGDFFESLTPRETEILELLADGASNKSIAYQLNISEHTVKFHVASIFGKLGVSTRTEAVMRGIKRGLILL